MPLETACRRWGHSPVAGNASGCCESTMSNHKGCVFVMKTSGSVPSAYHHRPKYGDEAGLMKLPYQAATVVS